MTRDDQPAIRQVDVLPPSVGAETANVLRLAVVIVAIGWIYLANTAAGGAAGAGPSTPGAPGARDLMPYQTLFRDLPPGEQRTFRALQEGLLEAEVARSSAGRWPPAAALAAQGIPPFAPDPTAKGPAYAWTLAQQGTMVNYLGLPRGSRAGGEVPGGAPAWLLSIQEPEPGAPPDRSPADEQHHRLADGTVLHVSIWSHRDGSRVAAGLVPLPHADGWTQLLAGTPALTRR
ncbi:MAG TPA: hypothetical protein VIH93_02445 [Thermoanaerobaculia bacterium]